MNNSIAKALSAVSIIMLLFSCSAKKISSDFYFEHQTVLEEIEQSYKFVRDEIFPLHFFRERDSPGIVG